MDSQKYSQLHKHRRRISGRRLVQTIGLRSETRQSWAVQPQALRKTRWVCAFTGAWGVLTGYAIFIQVSQQSRALPGNLAFWRFGAVLGVAVTVVAIIEWLRDLIHGGERKERRRTMASVLISVLLLGVFEMCVLAYEEVSRTGLENAAALKEVAERVTSSQHPYGFLSFVYEDTTPTFLLQLQKAQAVEQSSPARRIVELAPAELQQALRAAPLTNVPDFPIEMGSEERAAILANLVRPIWEAWLPETKGLSDNAAEAERFESVVLLLDQALAIPDFYREEDFRSVKGIERVKAELAEQEDLRARLAVLEREKQGAGARANEFAREQAQLTARLLPLRQVVSRNRELLDAAFPQTFPGVGAIQESGWDELEVLAGVWIVAGGVLGWFLGFSVFKSSGTSLRRAGRGAIEGALAALLFAPISVVLYILLARFAWWVNFVLEYGPFGGRPPKDFGGLMLYDYGAATTFMIRARTLTVLGSLVCLVILLFLWKRSSYRRSLAWILAGLAGLIIRLFIEGGPQRVAQMAAAWVLLFVVVIGFERRFGFEAPIDWAGWGLLAFLFAPDVLPGSFVTLGAFSFAPIVLTLLASLRRRWRFSRRFVAVVWLLNAVFFLYFNFTSSLLRVFLLIGLAWLVPGLFLGSIVPYLRPGSSLPRIWGILAMLVGAALGVVTWVRFQDLWWVSIPAALLIFTGALMQRGWSIEEYWPLAALVFGLLICGATFLFQKASFRGVLAGVYTELPTESLRTELGFYKLPKVPSRPYQVQMAQFAQDFEEKAAEEAQRLQPEERAVTQRLELALVGSLGFWLTIGLLAGWSIFKGQRWVVHVRGEPPRCFWARSELVEYHDRQHGILPRNDQELFARLSLEMLAGESAWARRDRFTGAFEGFDLEKASLLAAQQVKERLARQGEPASRAVLKNPALPMVIENAKRFLAFEAGQGGTDTTSAVLRDWKVRALSESGVAEPGTRLITYVRKAFQIPRSVPMRTFLQGVGILPGAHFPGCHCRSSSPDAESTAIQA